MKETLHTQLINTLKDLGFCTHRFAKRTAFHLAGIAWPGESAANRVIKRGRLEDEPTDAGRVAYFFEELQLSRIVPDAFLLGHHPKYSHGEWVVAVEVEVTHSLKTDKLDKYVGLSWMLDSHSAWFNLLHVNKTGHVLIALRDLCEEEDPVMMKQMALGMTESSLTRPCIGRITPSRP